MSRNLDRFLGGSPLSVVVRLVVLSIVVGVILAAIGFTPFDIVASVREMVRRVFSTGFDAVNWAWRYFLLGAVIVVPVFLLMRVLKAGRRERYEA
jgi:hypothetical protein